MALITFPATPTPAEIAWSLRQPTQVNRSEWTGRRKATILAGAARWMAQVTLPPLLGEKAVMQWRAFLAQCQGQAHWFRLVAVENIQISGVTVLVNGAGQAGYSVATDGWGAAGTKMKAGQFATINDQLLQLAADVVANGSGQATLSFCSFLRIPTTDNAAIEVGKPYALMSMTEDTNGWTVGRGQQYAISFGCEEAF
jgi:hypothetical protein